MANLNKILLIGRLTRDPEVRTFSNGGKVAKFGFAVNNRRRNNQSGEWEDEPVFVDCDIFNRGEGGRQADLVSSSLRKGQQIFIEGHLRMETWADSQTGATRTKLKVIVDNFQFLEKKDATSTSTISDSLPAEDEGADGPPIPAPPTPPPTTSSEVAKNVRGKRGGNTKKPANEEPVEATVGASNGDSHIPF